MMPTCCGRYMGIEPWGNMFLLKCKNPNHVYSQFAEFKNGRFYYINIERPRQIANKKDPIRTRVRMPDGSILSGLAGLRELERRQRIQSTGVGYKKTFSI